MTKKEIYLLAALKNAAIGFKSLETLISTRAQIDGKPFRVPAHGFEIRQFIETVITKAERETA